MPIPSDPSAYDPAHDPEIDPPRHATWSEALGARERRHAPSADVLERLSARIDAAIAHEMPAVLARRAAEPPPLLTSVTLAFGRRTAMFTALAAAASLTLALRAPVATRTVHAAPLVALVGGTPTASTIDAVLGLPTSETELLARVLAR
jgi:hypothetical protein